MDDGQALRIFHGQSSKPDRVYELENGGIRADAQGQRKERDGREAGRLRKGAQPVSNVLRLIGEEGVRVPDIRAWLASRRKLWRRR